MNTPYGDDGVDDSAYNRCEHGVLTDDYCAACENDDIAYVDRYDPDAEVKFHRENPREEDC